VIRRRELVILTASILLAALGTALVWLYVQGIESRANQAAELVPVLAADGDLPAGAPTTGLRLRTAYAPRVLAEGALTSKDDLKGKTATTRIAAGQLLLGSMFGPDPVPPIRPGNVAISLTIEDSRRVLPLVRPGQSAAVVQLDETTGVRVVVRSALIVGIGTETLGTQRPAGRRAGDSSPQVVTFDVSPADGRRLLALEATPGRTALALLGPGATFPAPTPTG
jgi:pilus assembly protein CpaB